MPPRQKEHRASLGRHDSPATMTTTTRIPLNDDDAEKAKRMKKRSILQEVQIARRQSAAFAATPRKSLDGGEGSVEGTPKTPRNVSLLRESFNAITPLRRPVLLVNFEEWMKMANDNKINAQNSWNFALIDYFHDMSLLKEGEGINFQKASCTLDGCVKIYTSRVDSVATETGKLLSGLADGATESARKKGRDDDEDGEEGEDGEDGEGKKKKKRTQRSSEATLAKDFASLQLKKLELEFSVDPLFKKASADFDEGGAKGLLLNHLAIDNKGRIVFDSSDDIEEQPEEEENKEGENGVGNEEIDISRLRMQFFPDLAQLDELDVCPSLKNYDMGDPTGSLDIPFLRALDEKLDAAGSVDGDGNSPDMFEGGGFDYEDDDFGEPGADGTMAFGEGGMVWASETYGGDVLAPPKPKSVYGDDDEDVDGGDRGADRFNTSMSGSGQHDHILSYFDEALRKNWAGPEHWKIRKIKDNTKTNNAPRVRKAKEVFEIDFMNPANDVTQDMLLPKSNATINLPKTQRKSKTKHLLPDDKHFNSKDLINLFLKPTIRFSSQKSSKNRPRNSLGGRNTGGNAGIDGRDNAAEVEDLDNVEMDEEFWAKQQMAKEIVATSTPGKDVATGQYDANFFNDDGGMDMLPPGLDDDDEDIGGVGGEAFEAPLPTPGTSSSSTDLNNPTEAGGATGGIQPPLPSQLFPPSSTFPMFGSTQEQIAMGSQLIASSRRARPEYVQYAKVAKKVDVRRLKENIWKELGMEMDPTTTHPATFSGPLPSPAPSSNANRSPSVVPPGTDGKGGAGFTTKNFTNVMENLKMVYPKQAMDDISTSYCFICVLHLANEKGLVLHSNQDMTDLTIEKDLTADGPDDY